MNKIIRINDVNEKEIQALTNLDNECIKLHLMPPIKTFINMKIHMPNNELVFEYNARSKSWIRNYYNGLLYASFGALGSTYAAGSTKKKQTNEALSDRAFEAPITGAAGSVTAGIIVGTGTTAESFESYILTTPVAHGNAAGQLAYSADTFGTPVYTAGTKKWTRTLERILNNNSDGTITITECGIYSNAYVSSHMLARDLLASAVDVVATAQLTVTYTFEMTFPA